MLTTILIGLSIGMILLLIAAGLSLIFGTLGLINFAHGALYMLGAFIGVQVVTYTQSFWLALVIAPIGVALIGVLIETTLLRPIYSQPHEKQLLLTFGILLLIEQVARLIWGMDFNRMDTPPVLAFEAKFWGQSIPAYRLFVIGLGLIIAASLMLFMEKTRFGIVLRAAMSNANMVRGLGIQVSRYRTFVFALGAALAGFAGVVAAPLLPVQVNMGGTIIIESFVVIIIGGLGNIGGAIIGAVLLGLVQAFGQQYAADWVDPTTYFLLVVLLIFRPQGLFALTARRRA